jgi:hypothetical protein
LYIQEEGDWPAYMAKELEIVHAMHISRELKIGWLEISCNV